MVPRPPVGHAPVPAGARGFGLDGRPVLRSMEQRGTSSSLEGPWQLAGGPAVTFAEWTSGLGAVVFGRVPHLLCRRL